MQLTLGYSLVRQDKSQADYLAENHDWRIYCNWTLRRYPSNPDYGYFQSLISKDDAQLLATAFDLDFKSCRPGIYVQVPGLGSFLGLGRTPLDLGCWSENKYDLRFSRTVPSSSRYSEWNLPDVIDLTPLTRQREVNTNQDWRPDQALPEDFYTASRTANQDFWTIHCQWKEYGEIDRGEHLYIGRLSDDDAELLAEALQISLPSRINGRSSWVSQFDDLLDSENNPKYSDAEISLSYDWGYYQLHVHSSHPALHLPPVIDLSRFVPEDREDKDIDWRPDSSIPEDFYTASRQASLPKSRNFLLGINLSTMPYALRNAFDILNLTPYKDEISVNQVVSAFQNNSYTLEERLGRNSTDLIRDLNAYINRIQKVDAPEITGDHQSKSSLQTSDLEGVS